MNNTHYIFDFDNTLVYTDKLNNESYNYALKTMGYKPINSYLRVTRNVIIEVYPHLRDEELSCLVNLKQDYYVKNVYKSKCNEGLINLLKGLNPNRCVLWTSADLSRVLPTLNYFNIHDCFGRKIHSLKTNIEVDLLHICTLVKCNIRDLVVFEDNARIIEDLMLNGVEVVRV